MMRLSAVCVFALACSANTIGPGMEERECLDDRDCPSTLICEDFQCLPPLPGERIVGIRDDEGGVLVHTIYCDTLAAEDPPQSRWLDLKWRDSEDDEISAFARITITVQNGVGVLSEVAGIIARYGVSIASMRLVNRSREFLDMVMDVEVKDAKQLSQMLAGVRAAPSVIAAERLGSKDDEEL